MISFNAEMKRSKQMKQYRQGDVLVRQVIQLPEAAVEAKPGRDRRSLGRSAWRPKPTTR